MLRGHSYPIPDDDPDQFRFKRQSTWDPSYGGGTIIRYRKPPINRPMLWVSIVLIAATAALLYFGGKECQTPTASELKEKLCISRT